MNKMNGFSVILFLAALFTFAACRQPPRISLSPTEVYKFQNQAVKDKHVGMVKQTLSRDSIEMITRQAGKSGMTFDEFIKRIPSEGDTATFEFRNEQINGDAATVEVKSSKNNRWSTTHFIKEEGEWKVDMVKDMNSPEN